MPDASTGLALRLRATGYDHPDAVALVSEVQQVYVHRYGDADKTPVDPADFAPPLGHFVVGYAAVGDAVVGSTVVGDAVVGDAVVGGAAVGSVLGSGPEQPVACGGWRLRGHTHEDPVLRDGDVEIKRMYVVDAARGRGYARRVLAELERTAAEVGARRMVLETGTRQPEAIALYRSSGYRPIPNFGVYRHAPNSRCFAKPLD